MDIKLTLTLTEHGRKHTGFGWERIDIIETVICVGEYSSKDGPTGSFGVFPVVGDEIFEDLFMNYDVEIGANSHLLCAICGR